MSSRDLEGYKFCVLVFVSEENDLLLTFILTRDVISECCVTDVKYSRVHLFL